MKLTVGARLPHDFTEMSDNEPLEVERNRPVYRVTHVLRETPWSCLYRGKKVFRNCDFKTGQVSEADDDECLDVLIRTLAYPRLDDRNWVKARREHARFEVQSVLGCISTNLIPEPLDVLEVHNQQDAFSFAIPSPAPAEELILVFEQIHGLPLDVWRKQPGLSVMRRLDVLSQILQFMSALHGQGLFVNAWSPQSFSVDAQDQVHFLGSENVLAAKHAAPWRMLFPADRYVAGFLAPEMLNPSHAPTTQSDLHGWASVAWLLLTGDSPAQIAGQQQRRWAQFDASHRDRLTAELEQVPTAFAQSVRDLFQVSGQRFARQWPESFLSSLWSCLQPDAGQRPGTVADLRSAWREAPPPPVSCCLAVKGADQKIRVLISPLKLSAGLEFSIVAKQGRQPTARSDGEEIWTGKSPTSVDLSTLSKPTLATRTSGDWFYSVFTIDRHEGHESVSHATQAQAFDATTPNSVIVWADAKTSSRQLLPDELELLSYFNVEIPQELLRSKLPQTRGWGIDLLERRLQRDPNDHAARNLMWMRGLVDPEFTVRQHTVSVLVRATVVIDPEFVTRLAQRLAGEDVDNSIRIARWLVSFGIDAAIIEQAIDGLEGQRLVNCSVCQESLRKRDEDGHLVEVHGYVPSEGEFVPLDTALDRLWPRVLRRLETTALDELLKLFTDWPGHQRTSSLTNELEQQALRTMKVELAAKSNALLQVWIRQLGSYLGRQSEMERACLSLLGHSDSNLRRLAREVLFPSVTKRLATPGLHNGLEYLDIVETLCPIEKHEERLETCRRLEELGADLELIKQCREELEQRRIVTCADCGDSMANRELGSHRRLKHGVYEWQGKRYSWALLEGLLTQLSFRRGPDLLAATTLVQFVGEQHGPESCDRLTRNLCGRLGSLKSPTEQTAVAIDVGKTLASLPIAGTWASRLLKEALPACRAAGFTLFAQADATTEQTTAEHATVVARQLADRDVELSVRKEAVIKLVRRAEQWPDACLEGLREFAKSIGSKWEGLKALLSLRQWVGQSAVFEEFLADWESKTQIRCACGCNERFTPSELDRHARQDHGLVLDGLRFRKPWLVALDRLESYADNGDPNLLQQGAELAVFSTQKEPDLGWLRFWREALNRQIAVKEARTLVATVAKSAASAVCPSCFEFVVLGDTPPEHVEVTADGQIRSATLTISNRSESWLWNEVEFSNSKFDPPDPVVTRAGWMAAVLVLCWTPAVIMAMNNQSVPAWWLFGIGIVGLVIVSRLRSIRRPEPIDAAWQSLVPQLLDKDSEQRVIAEHWSFLAGLAQASVGRGNPRSRNAALQRAIDVAFLRTEARLLSDNCLPKLIQLEFHDAIRSRMLVRKLHIVLDVVKHLLWSVLEGRLPLTCLEAATVNGRNLSLLEGGSVVALAWLFVEWTVQKSATPQDIQALARRSPTIAKLLELAGTSSLDSFAMMSAVWQLRNQGKVPEGMRAVPDELRAGRATVLEKRPLRYVQYKGYELWTELGGVRFQGELHTVMPSVEVITARRSPQATRTENCISINGVVCAKTSSTHATAAAIRQIAAFYFQTLRPLADIWLRLPPTGTLDLPNRMPVSCRSCGTLMNAGLGEFGVAIEEAANAG